MANSSNLQRWPAEAVELAECIAADVERINSLIGTCQVEGIREKNYRIVDILLPIIKNKARSIKSQARRICQMAGNRRGRPPKWLEVSMDAVAQADKIIMAIELIGPERKQDNWIVVGRLIDVIAVKTEAIQAGIELVPLEATSVADEILKELMDG